MEREGPGILRSGLLLFASRLLSIGTGLVFTLMITRTVTREEYGVWVNLNADIVSYFTLLATALPFWVMRFVSRRHEGAAKTGVVANMILGLVSTTLYALMAPWILSALKISNAYLPLYLLASIQIVWIYLVVVFESILRAVKIEALGYGLLVGEVAKVAAAYLFIFHLKLGLLGAMGALIAGYSLQVFYYLYISRGILKGRLRLSYFKEWFKGSLATIYAIIGTRVFSFSLVLLFAIGREVARAYYGASSQIAGVIGYSSFLAFALYPRLLVRRNPRDVVTAFKSFLMFAVPMTMGAIVLSDSYLTILNVKYRVASPVLQAMALNVFVQSLTQLLNSIIFGTEKIDLEAKIELRELVKTRLFLVFSFPYLRALITLPTVYYILLIVRDDPLTSALYTVLIILLSGVLFLVLSIVFAKEAISFSFPWISLAKYLLASAFMAILLFLIPHPTRLLATLGYTIIGGILYFSILAAIDKEARGLVKSILTELRSKLKTL
ncbi:MAG TPA: hypothetical protein ENF56_04125 [Candidatus Bathyarchaeota archaeon]|nr:hypothetical protein [Candidatus Bathyarchaeota archaeon]